MAKPSSYDLKEFREQKKKGIEALESYLTQNAGVSESVRLSLESQTQESSPEVFQYLYECVSMKRKSSKVFSFVMQFVPNLILLYLQSVTDNYQKLKVPIEVLLLAIMKEIETNKESPIQVPVLTKPSIYHQSTSANVSQLRLTESALNRHNHDQMPGAHPSITPSFTEITVFNRLPFLVVIGKACINDITQFTPQSQRSFCLICTRISLSGLTQRCIQQVIVSTGDQGGNQEEGFTRDNLLSLGKAKRINLTDDFLACLLNGIRMCLFRPCHLVAKQALLAVRVRAEYDFYPQSLLISQTLERQVNEIHPLRLPLDTEIHKTYSERDASNWACRPSTVIRTLIGQVLHHNLNPIQPTVDSPHDVLEERLSIDTDELLVSQSYEDTGPRIGKAGALEGHDSPDGAASFTVADGDQYLSSDDEFTLKEIDESPSTSRMSSSILSPSNVVVAVNSTEQDTVKDSSIDPDGEEIPTDNNSVSNDRGTVNTPKTTEV